METLQNVINLSDQAALESALWKFIARVEPIDKTHYRWYVNFDEDTEQNIEVIVEGRKNNPVVMLDTPGDHNNEGVGEDTVPPAPLHISEETSLRLLDSLGKKRYNRSKDYMEAVKLSYLISLRDRPLSSRRNNRQPGNSPRFDRIKNARY